MDKLDEIIAWKRQEIAPDVRPVTEAELARLNDSLPRPPSFASALRRADERLAVIAEIKRRSPSAGAIRPAAAAPRQASRYLAAGADALSVLTDTQFFGGSLSDLTDVVAGFAAGPRALPCLRKDFIVHPVQILQARQAGASAILLIARVLADDEMRRLSDAATAAGLDVLFEVHDERETDRVLDAGALIIGVNNRDLATFTTDLAMSERLIPRMPRDRIAVSESGIWTAADAARARGAGARAVLVGEALMRAEDTSALIAGFRG